LGGLFLIVSARFERAVAWRYLRPQRSRGFVSLVAGFSFLGIALGVATLIIVMSVMNGFREELIGRILGINGHIHIYGYNGPLEEYEERLNLARQVPGVLSAAPMVEGQALLTVKGYASGAVVRGLTTAGLMATPKLAQNLTPQALERLEGASVLIGRRMAERYGLNLGDKLSLIAPQGSATAFGTVARTQSFEVVGIFEVGMFEYDNNFVFMQLSVAARFFRLPEGAVTGIEIRLENPDKPQDAKFRLQTSLGADHIRLYDWQDNNASFISSLQVERNVMFLILTLIILVADFNIISSMVMLVKEKRRDIAILRTMGASRAAILRIFCRVGGLIGLIGTGIGFLLGVLFVENIEAIRQFIEYMTQVRLFPAEIYYLTQLPAKLDWQEVWLVGGMALSLAFLSALYPAWKAAKLDPIEALRHE
jgi:lipoprotein-releasing system permease protein